MQKQHVSNVNLDKLLYVWIAYGTHKRQKISRPT